MGKLAWNSYGENVYEHGVDRVVAYPEGGIGVAWSGVTRISEKNDTAVDGYYLDGLKYVQVPSYGEYSASLEAYWIPLELNLCLGFAQLSPGLFATNQRRRSFGLAYRTFIGNEDSNQMAYKLHLVYNAVANPSFGESTTIKDSPEPTSHSLELTTMPPSGAVSNLQPTAHLILDSRYAPAAVMEDVEQILYGTEVLEPRLPTPNELLLLTSTSP